MQLKCNNPNGEIVLARKLTHKCRHKCLASNEWQGITFCRIEMQLFILGIRDGKGRSSTIAWLPTSALGCFLYQWFS